MSEEENVGKQISEESALISKMTFMTLKLFFIISAAVKIKCDAIGKATLKMIDNKIREICISTEKSHPLTCAH